MLAWWVVNIDLWIEHKQNFPCAVRHSGLSPSTCFCQPSNFAGSCIFVHPKQSSRKRIIHSWRYFNCIQCFYYFFDIYDYAGYCMASAISRKKGRKTYYFLMHNAGKHQHEKYPGKEIPENIKDASLGNNAPRMEKCREDKKHIRGNQRK